MAYFALQVKRYFGSTMYLINTIVGPMMLIVFMIIGSFSGVDEIKIYLLMFEREGLLVPILSAAILFTSSICMITASTISLEGKNINMLKSLPLSITTIFQAKIALQVVITMVVNVVAIIMGLLLYDISFMTALVLTVISLIASILYAVLGLLINLLFPKMEWDSETIVVKQSMSVIVAMVGSMLIAGLHVVGYLVLIDHIPFMAIVAIFMLLDVLIIYTMWRYLLVGGAKRFISL
jgi:ABC-2 type transport system permease protein